MQLKVKKVYPDAELPEYATAGSACFDLKAYIPESGVRSVNAYKPIVLETGLAFEIPEGHVMLVHSRSGHGFNHDVRLANCTGVIDSDYRGQVRVKLTRDHETAPFTVKHGDRIAQAMIVPVDSVEFIEVDELSETERGEGGYGSTGR